MSRDVRDQTLADYLVIAVSPALIMTLIGSLIWFLLEIVYQGEFQSRMRWILSCYIFGCVLVARVAMQSESAVRAPIYSLVLGVAAWVGCGMFVEYPEHLLGLSWAINLGFVFLIWWCAQKLTWDCTYIDDQVDPGKRGLLQETGLEKPVGQVANLPDKQASSKLAPQEAGEDTLNWWERFRRYREGERKKHTPGTWVVYFSLAALPLFGLLQALIPSEETDRRQYTFLLLAVYVASGLGLLLTTCFLGLRRYLRQRKLQMPAAMTGTWLSLGGVLIAVLLVVGAVLPRPSSETPLFEFTPLGARKREASDYAMMKDSSAKEKGRPGEAGREKDGPMQKKDGQPQKDSGDRKDGQGGNQKDGGKGNQKDSGKGGQNDSGDKKGDPQAQNKGDPAKDKKENAAKKQDGGSSQRDDKSDSAKERKEQRKDGSSSVAPNRSFFKHIDGLGRIGQILKWIVFGVLAAVVVFCLLRSGLQWLAHFTNWARDLLNALRNFWARLFGSRGKAAAAATNMEPDEATKRPPRSFRSFRNPFEDGRAERLPPDEVVRYSFMALQAWAYERDLGRELDETPLEFASRVGGKVPGLDEDARRLATLYARAVYARGTLPASSLAAVRQFWEKLEAVVEQPLSA
jgi:hypothetical protein